MLTKSGFFTPTCPVEVQRAVSTMKSWMV